MVLFLALRELWRKRHCGILGVVFSIFFAVGMLRVMATKPNPGGPSMAPSILLTGEHIQRMMDELSDEKSKPHCVLQSVDLSSFDSANIRKK